MVNLTNDIGEIGRRQGNTSICGLPFPDDSVDDIIIIQVFEHLLPEPGARALKSWYPMLAPGGRLLISVPDMIETAELLLAADAAQDLAEVDRVMALIHGTHKDGHAHHYQGFTRSSLERTLRAAGFVGVQPYPSFHNYPALIAEAFKPAEA